MRIRDIPQNAERKEYDYMKKQMAAFAAGILLAGMTGCVPGKQNVLNSMAAATSERAGKLAEFAADAEQMLTVYSNAEQITALLRDPDNRELAEKARVYTESFSQDIENNDGIYASTPETRILTHTDSSVVGIITRSDEAARNTLLNSLKVSGDGINNQGIIRSPKTGSQVLSMYKAVRNEKDELIGYTGLGVKTDALAAENRNVTVSGLKNASYIMLSAADAKYIFAPDDGQTGQKTQSEEIQRLCGELCAQSSAAEGTLEYRDDSGKYIAAYSYLPEYEWLLMLKADA